VTVSQSLCGDLGLDDIVALNVFVERYSHIADEPRLRWWIYNRHSNGLKESGAVVKRAGRWFVVPKRLLNWLLQSGGPD